MFRGPNATNPDRNNEIAHGTPGQQLAWSYPKNENSDGFESPWVYSWVLNLGINRFIQSKREDLPQAIAAGG